MRDLTYPPDHRDAPSRPSALLGQRFQMTGTEHVPRCRRRAAGLNHIGYVDFVYGGLRREPVGRLVRFMAKRELFDHRWTGPLMRSLHHIEVDRGRREPRVVRRRGGLPAGRRGGRHLPRGDHLAGMELKEFKTGRSGSPPRPASRSCR